MHSHASPSASDGQARIAIIGLGPRGASLIERLGAHLSTRPQEPRLELHLIDDSQPGPGRIWRTDQTRELCMNTLADAVTLFTEPGATVTGPVIEGPTLFEWCVLARETSAGPVGSTIPRARTVAFAEYPARPGVTADYREELAQLRPESHPSRALYGEYLAWFYQRAVAELPAGVRVIHHRARATAIERDDCGERISLDRPTMAGAASITVDAVIAATGWLPRTPTRADATLEAGVAQHSGLTWVRDGSPVEQDLDGILPGEHAIVRGLGMGFFDTLTLLTLGRGGTYVADTDAPGGLTYLPSGREPILHVTSRRGVPFRAKSRYGGLPPRAEQRLLREVDWREVPRPIDFDRLLWPRIVGDAFLAHAATLRRVAPAALGDALSSDPDAVLAQLERAVRAAIAPVLDGTLPADITSTVALVTDAVAPLIPDPAHRLDLAGEISPVDHSFANPAAFDAWVADRVAADLREVDLGENSPAKAGFWSVSSARGFAAQVGTLGGFDAESRSSGATLLTALGAMLGSGPPAFRNNELLALAAAGVVHFVGPEARLTVDERGFVASSAAVAGSEVTARALIDAWMHSHDARASADPLTQSLLEAGRARVFTVAARRRSGPVETAGIDIDAATGRLIGADGELDPAIHFSGIPVDATLHGTVISPMPGTDPPMLRETDRVSRSALETAIHSASSPLSEGALSA